MSPPRVPRKPLPGPHDRVRRAQGGTDASVVLDIFVGDDGNNLGETEETLSDDDPWLRRCHDRRLVRFNRDHRMVARAFEVDMEFRHRATCELRVADSSAWNRVDPTALGEPNGQIQGRAAVRCAIRLREIIAA